MSTRKLPYRNERITQERFDLLPALLTAWQVKAVTGWQDKELYAAVESGAVKVWQPAAREGRQRAYRKFLKVSVAEIVGFKC
jgi:hypothetical protein